jgi:23S rRNA pseudouridine2605 synthase
MKKPSNRNYKPKGKTSPKPISDQITAQSEPSEGVRINKYIADAGVCSRREADKLIAAGEITVNGEVVTELGKKVLPTDSVKYNGKLLKKERFIYILLNKPKDYITTSSDEQGRKTVLDLISGACSERVYPVGRLDRNTTGLLLFTNDGELTKRLTHPSFNVSKTYVAELDENITKEQLEMLTNGVELEDGFSKFDSVEFEKGNNSRKTVIVNIHSGKNRIVRRMFEHLGFEVKKLDRTNFAGLKKGSVTRGKWRFLAPKEVGYLKMVK